MRRLMILTAVMAVLSTASGCWHWFNRGATCNSCGAPACGPSGAYMGAPAAVDGYQVQPGPVPGQF